MITVYHCRPEQFCPCQKETGGEVWNAPAEIRCTGDPCPFPEKQCLFRQAMVAKERGEEFYPYVRASAVKP